MSPAKIIKDWLIKQLSKKLDIAPNGLVELQRYFRSNGPIEFKFEKQGDYYIAVSQNFRHGSIIASAKNNDELDEKIKDAILTSFKIPSVYKVEAEITRRGEKREYAAA